MVHFEPAIHLKAKNMNRAIDTSDRDKKKVELSFIFVRPNFDSSQVKHVNTRDNSIVTIIESAFGKSNFRSPLRPTRMRRYKSV